MPDKKIELEVAEGMIAVLKSAVAPIANEDTLVAGIVKIAKMLDEEGQNKVRMALRLLAGLPDLPEGAMEALASAAGIEMAAADETAMSKAAHEAAVVVAVKKAVDEALAKAKPGTRKIIKAAGGVEIDLATIPEEQRPAFEALAKSVEESDAKLAKEVAERTHRDLIEKSKVDYPHLDHGKIATVLQKSAGDAAATKLLGEVLKQAEELAKAGGLGELGNAGAGAAGTAYGKIEALAASLVAKSEGKMTAAQAQDAVLKTAEGKALYAEYRAEQQ